MGIPPPPILKDTDQHGFNDIIVDPGGIVRRGLLFLDDTKMSFIHLLFGCRFFICGQKELRLNLIPSTRTFAVGSYNHTAFWAK